MTRSYKILVVEDNPTNLKLCRDLLKFRGHRVVEAINGKQALDLAQKEMPDLILMDIELPIMDGIEVVQRLKKIPTMIDMPILAVTARAMKGDQEILLSHGFAGYIAKPINTRMFVTEIESYIPVEDADD